MSKNATVTIPYDEYQELLKIEKSIKQELKHEFYNMKDPLTMEDKCTTEIDQQDLRKLLIAINAIPGDTTEIRLERFTRNYLHNSSVGG